MAHLQYMPGDPRLVDQLVYELKSKGIFDKFRKECIADVDTRPAYQNLRQRVENSVSTFLSRQCWKPDLNKNQLREKLRKHILDGNYLEQGVERIVDQVVNPKVASVFIPQVEDLVYNYLGITRKKSITTAETSNGKSDDLLPTDLEAVSPGSVKSNDDKNETIDVEMTDDTKDSKMEIDEANGEVKDENSITIDVIDKEKDQDTRLSGISELMTNDSESIDKISIPLPSQDISLDNIPAPDNSPPKQPVDLETIQLPSEPNPSTDIPLPDEPPKEKDQFFKPVNSDDDDSSSDSSLRRNMSPLTPIRNFNNENSCDAQQAFENDSDSKTDEKKEPSSFRFTIEAKCDNSTDAAKVEKKDTEQTELTFQFNNQVNISFNTPLYEDSSNSNNLHIDYESDVNSKINIESKLPEGDNSEDSKKDKKVEDKKSSQKSSHRSRDSSRHASSKDKRSDSKHSSRDSSRHDRKSKDESKSKSSNKERDRSRDRSERKDSRDSSKHRSSHKSSSNRDSKSSSHRSSTSSQRHTSKHSDDKKSSSKEKSTESSKNKEKAKDSKSVHRSDREKDRKSKKEDKDKKKDKKDTDDHYSLSGRGNHTRRSTDRDSNDGSSSSKGSSNPSNTKSTESKKENKGSSKSENTSTCGESTSPSDKEVVNTSNTDIVAQARPIVRVERDLEVPIAAPPRLPFVPDVTLKKPKFAANFEEAKRLMKMRKFLDEEQKRMNQEAALLLEFQANVRPSLSQVYSSIPGPELEFACVTNPVETAMESQPSYEIAIEPANIESRQMTVQEIENIIGVNVTSNISDTMYFDEEEEPKREVNDNEPNTTAQEVESRLVKLTKDDDDKSQDGTKPEITEEEGKIEDRYDDNIDKPFSDIIDEITKYKNASDSKIHLEKDDPNMEKLHDDDNKKRTEFFEITIITEELTEGEDDSKKDVSGVKSEKKTTLTSPVRDPEKVDKKPQRTKPKKIHGEYELEYFGEIEKYNAEVERDKFGTFLKNYIEQWATSKVYLINCDKYEENIIKDVLDTMGRYETVSYYKNGHVNLTNVVKNINLIEEISLPLDSSEEETPKDKIFSPVKSDCSFELSSEYDAKLQEMVNKTSRQEVMEIILGGVIETPSEMPRIDYCNESRIESGELKRKCEVETVNNNTQILTPNKIRKISESDQISSTTEETELSNNNRVQSSTRSKYLGRAKRVGLSRPKKTVLPNSPSSDKSVENYEQNTPSTQTPNGKIKSTPRLKIQRYDTSDLYKPKLHYLSRRNNIS